MSGQNVPYQLRTNKFVERQLFLDVLDFVRVWNGPTEYVYAAMGGQFLEDFKMMNDRFAIEHMVSVESDETTWKRQHFNRPVGLIDCRKQKSSEFIVDFDRLVADYPAMKFIIWLDYTDANARGVQLREYQELAAKLASGDVVKITINANYQSYRRRHQFAVERDYQLVVIQNMTEQLGDYMPSGGMSAAHLTANDFARLLARAVKLAALKGNKGSDLRIVPLASYRYSDGEHSMLTVTAVLADKDLAKQIEQDEGFRMWKFRSRDWDDVHHINVPHLSARERLLINQLIESEATCKTIHDQLPFRLESKDDVSLGLLTSYLDHYRRYPTFHRVQM